MSLKDELNDIHAENRLASERATAEQEAARQRTSLQYERDKVRRLANFIAHIPDRLREAAKAGKHSLVVSRIADEFDVPQGWGIRRAGFDEWANKARFHHSNYGDGHRPLAPHPWYPDSSYEHIGLYIEARW